MRFRVGVDVGGTFTDFLLTCSDGSSRVFKVLSTPDDPSRALVQGLGEMAAQFSMGVEEFAGAVGTIVHGTTVTTNAVLTRGGARTGLLTTEGVRDALEMRRGIREEQYNNRFTNVEPLVPRHLRLAINGRLDAGGREVAALDGEGVRAAAEAMRQADVESVAICFMNSFANPGHERQAARTLRESLPGAYVSVSSELLPAIRFYDRLSTTVLNAYVGPKLRAYLDALMEKLASIRFKGVLLVMQSNGGVVSPEVLRERAAMSLLSGPAAGPRAGVFYASIHDFSDCVTVDMGGTSFDAALVRAGRPEVVTEGEIDRLRLSLPMLDITTIGAGGGSVGWIDKGGLLRVGPRSAGARPGPACYGFGGEDPTVTDADLLLGYLDPDYFAGGRMKLHVAAAREAMSRAVGARLGMSAEEAAVGVTRVIDSSMAAGVRMVTVRRGHDPREFPLVVAGGAGPLHCCAICTELEMPVFLVPRQSSIFCAAGMLMSDLVHDDVRTMAQRMDRLDRRRFESLLDEMISTARETLRREGVADADMRFEPSLDMRYLKQYHEVNVVFDPTSPDPVSGFHEEHDRLYGYNLEQEGTPVEVINLRLRSVGITEKPSFPDMPRAGRDPAPALKGRRLAWVPERGEFENVPVLDAERVLNGMIVSGPALVEQANTTLFLSASYDLACDRFGNFVGFARDRADALPTAIREMRP